MNRQSGFSLLEMAISLLILGLVVLGFKGVFELLSDTEHQKTERENMYTINQALEMYLSVNSHLPCPDTYDDASMDGLEDRDPADGVCYQNEGHLPYRELGVEGTDAWGNPYYYKVHENASVKDTDSDPDTQAPIYEICEEASVFGRSGTGGTQNLWLCPSSNIYYCSGACSFVCDDTCTQDFNPANNDIDPDTDPPYTDPRLNIGQAPFFHLATPPIGTQIGSGNLTVENEAGETISEGVVAVVVSWGANGKEVNRKLVSGTWQDNCSGGSTLEMKNCDNDSNQIFVNTKTAENRDFITWVTVNQAKAAIINSEEIK